MLLHIDGEAMMQGQEAAPVAMELVRTMALKLLSMQASCRMAAGQVGSRVDEQ